MAMAKHLEKQVLSVIASRRNGATFVALAANFPDEFKEKYPVFYHPKASLVILWYPVSSAMVEALTNLSNDHDIVVERSSTFQYLQDTEEFRATRGVCSLLAGWSPIVFRATSVSIEVKPDARTEKDVKKRRHDRNQGTLK